MLRRLAAAALPLAAAALTIAAATPATGGVYGSVQSPARPFGLDVVDLVQIRNSDTAARTFSRTGYDWMRTVITQPGGINNTLSSPSATTVLLDPGRLSILNDYSARMYFVNENTAFHNTLGFNPTGTGVSRGAQLIFPDATRNGGRRQPNSPLKRRDFVDLGLVTGGSVLDFFLIADGANGGTNVFSMDAGANPDGLNHVAIQARTDADSPYLLLGFEDVLGGGDLSMQDTMVALDIGVDNVKYLLNTVGAPEPGSLAALGTMLLAGVGMRRRRSSNKTRTATRDAAERP